MKIAQLYGRYKPVFSFEFFPPTTDVGSENLFRTVADLKSSLEPDFVSVTYGAGGSTRERTHDIVTRIQNELGTTAMAHQTCVGDAREGITQNVQRLVDAGITNVLALRGDRPAENLDASPPADGGGFAHATDLIEHLNSTFDISIGAACYPETHPESGAPGDDMQWTKQKIALGAGFLITQLFFDNAHYFAFVEQARAVGITVPIVPGIMPVTNVAQVERFTKMCGATIPRNLMARLKTVQDDPAAVMAVGIEHAIEQCRDLLGRGAPGLHFYTLNSSFATRSILAAIKP